MEAVGQLPPQDWLTFPETVKVMNALMAGGNTVRFVGGCVRDALAGRAISDVDIATTEPPTKVVRLLKDAGIQVVPIGLDHGSVLAVQPHMTYHITTLRADLETYGRHALVNYIDDWKEDAVRRDFTMNALYADLDGTFYDPAGGLEDIKTGCVRFIGDPMERIQEDYLRILRFFRFQAYYGKVPPAQEQLEACQQTAPHLRQLSGERVWYELKRLLLADNPTAVLEQMEAYGILSVLFSFPTSTINVGLLVKLEQQYNVPNNPIRRLACMVGKNFEAARHIRDDMTLSTQELSSLIMLT
jgi:poly(A) polymerase